MTPEAFLRKGKLAAWAKAPPIRSRYDQQNDLHFNEILSISGKVIERRVTRLKGVAVNDTHYSGIMVQSFGRLHKPRISKFINHKFLNRAGA